MSYPVYKKFGRQLYAYEVESHWDKKEKKVKKKSKYIGVVVDKEKKLFERRRPKAREEKLTLDFGDSFAVHAFLSSSASSASSKSFFDALREVFGEKSDMLFSLIQYKLSYGGAMMHANNWFEGSFARVLFKSVSLDSRRISEFLTNDLGNEKLQREFFARHICGLAEGIIIDATSLPNQIHMPMTAWGRSGEEIDMQVRFLLVVDRRTATPLFFRTVAGNIVDVSTLQTTIKELEKYGVKDCFLYSDAGFFSEENVLGLYGKGINFLTRLPATTALYKELILGEVGTLEDLKHGVRYGKRGLFVKEAGIDLFGKKAYAYLVLDPKRKGREMDRLIVENLDEREKNPDPGYDFLKRGVMILVSSFRVPTDDVVPAYYVRQAAEVMFGFSKDDISILPLRVHSEAALSGFLFLQFLTLIAFTKLKKGLGKKFSVEEALLSLKNLKCKVYGNEIIVNELTKQQKEIADELRVMVPKSLGI